MGWGNGLEKNFGFQEERSQNYNSLFHLSISEVQLVLRLSFPTYYDIFFGFHFLCYLLKASGFCLPISVHGPLGQFHLLLEH